MLEFLAQYHVNEYAGIVGLFATVSGFALTLWKVSRTRNAAEAASQAAEHVRRDLRKVETVAEFSSAIAVMEEIKRLHRKGEMDHLPERYSSLRRSLIALRASNPLLNHDDQSLLQQAIAQFAAFERQIEKALALPDGAKVDFVRLNRIVSSTIDELYAVLTRVRGAIGDGK